MSLEILQILMYLVVAAAVVMYVVLDGFDLGVGALHLFTANDQERRIFLNSIGPFWDGNEVWLIIIGGALFVGFPDVYATVFSGFYIYFMVFLAGIIFRAVAIEFRSKRPSKKWRNIWDFVFWFSSIAIIFDAGIILANLIKGVPVDANRELYYPFIKLFSPYTIIVSLMTIFLFTLHGNHFLLMKTEGKLQEKLHRWTKRTTPLFVFFFLVVTIWTWIQFPYMIARYFQYPAFILAPILMVAAIVAMIFCTRKGYHGFSFLCTLTTIALLFVLFAIGYFPNLVISTLDPANNSLTLYNASSSEVTLAVALIICLIGVPLVLAYGAIIYHAFRGKTKLHDHSY